MPNNKGAYLHEEISPLAEEVKDAIFLQTRGQVLVCGSLRRQCPEIGDIDILTTCSLPQVCRVVQTLAAKKDLSFIPLTKLKSGRDRKGRGGVDLRWDFLLGEYQINVCYAEPAYWGAALLYFTGSSYYNIWIRSQAKKQGYKLNEKGLWLGQERIAGVSEEQIYEALGLPYEDPVYRSLGRGAGGKLVNFHKSKGEKEKHG